MGPAPLRAAACVALLGIGVGVPTAASAEPGPTLWSDGEERYLKPILQLDSAILWEHDAWLGEPNRNVGGHVGFWSEWGIKFGLEGSWGLAEHGTLRGSASGVFTTTRFGLDAAGSNRDLSNGHPTEVTLEDASIGWSSGDLFPQLGEDAIDVSVGSQGYSVGTGFLFADGATDGGKRGGYWISMRRAFRMTAIARLATGPFLGELVYLHPNDLPDTSTDLAGANLEWSFGERATLGGGYWHVFDSDDPRRDGLHVFDLRGSVRPLARLPGLVVSAELVHERNQSANRSWGGAVELGHEFAETRWSPYLSVRYAGFSGDHGTNDTVEAFDPLYYDIQDWSTWYVGEILGEYIAANRNLDVVTARLRLEPAEAWTFTCVYSWFHLDEFANRLTPRLFDPRAVLIRDKNIGHELDLAVDWETNEYLSWSAVFGALFPGKGLEQALRGDSVWTSLMLYASIRF
jgi:hypothetical protein